MIHTYNGQDALIYGAKRGDVQGRHIKGKQGANSGKTGKIWVFLILAAAVICTMQVAVLAEQKGIEVQTEQAQSQPTITFEGEQIEILSNKVPLSPFIPTWAVGNLILLIITIAIALTEVAAFVSDLRKFKAYHGEDTGSETELRKEREAHLDYRHKTEMRVAGVLLTSCAIILFVLTQNLSYKMEFTDDWTLLMLIIATGQLLLALLSKNNRKKHAQKHMHHHNLLHMHQHQHQQERH